MSREFSGMTHALVKLKLKKRENKKKIKLIKIKRMGNKSTEFRNPENFIIHTELQV